MADVGFALALQRFQVSHQTATRPCCHLKDHFFHYFFIILFAGEPWAEEGVALMEQAAGQGHAYAMYALGDLYRERKEHERAVEWYTNAAEAGLPRAMFDLGVCLDQGEGVAAPDYSAAADWYMRAADAGDGVAAKNVFNMYTLGHGRAWQIMPATSATFWSLVSLFYMATRDAASIICQALGRGVTRSKRKTMQWMRKAAENGGGTNACLQLAARMYLDIPYAREVGLVGEATVVATSAGLMDGHDVPQDVLTSVVYWLRKGGHNPVDRLDGFRTEAQDGRKYCRNEGCEVVGHLKDFKVCPQCKSARYCGDACQKQDWTTGGHKATCGTLTTFYKHVRPAARGPLN